MSGPCSRTTPWTTVLAKPPPFSIVQLLLSRMPLYTRAPNREATSAAARVDLSTSLALIGLEVLRSRFCGPLLASSSPPPQRRRPQVSRGAAPFDYVPLRVGGPTLPEAARGIRSTKGGPLFLDGVRANHLLPRSRLDLPFRSATARRRPTGELFRGALLPDPARRALTTSIRVRSILGLSDEFPGDSTLLLLFLTGRRCRPFAQPSGSATTSDRPPCSVLYRGGPLRDVRRLQTWRIGLPYRHSPSLLPMSDPLSVVLPSALSF